MRMSNFYGTLKYNGARYKYGARSSNLSSPKRERLFSLLRDRIILSSYGA